MVKRGQTVALLYAPDVVAKFSQAEAPRELAQKNYARVKELFDKEHQWMITQMQQHLRQVNDMLINEQRRAQKRYKEYDGCYLGHYVQWFFWFFFVLGFFVFTSVIIMIVGKSLNWF